MRLLPGREAHVRSASVSNFPLVPVPLEGTIGNQNRRRLCAKNQRSTKPVAVVEAQGRIAAFPERLARQLHSGCCCCCCVSPGNSPVNFPATRRGRRKIGRGTSVPREKQVALLQNLMYISFIIILGITCLAAVTKSGILYIARAQRVLVAIRRPSPNGASEGRGNARLTVCGGSHDDDGDNDDKGQPIEPLMRVFLARQRSFPNSRRDVRQSALTALTALTRNVTALSVEFGLRRSSSSPHESIMRRFAIQRRTAQFSSRRQRDIITRRGGGRRSRMKMKARWIDKFCR